MASDATVRRHAKEVMQKYKELYVQKFGTAPLINSYLDLWGFINMVEDLEDLSIKRKGLHRALEVVEYYMTLQGSSELQKLFREYHRLSKAMDERAADRAKLNQIAKETEERVRKWEAQNAAGSGTTS
jgi:hypothetical protein